MGGDGVMMEGTLGVGRVCVRATWGREDDDDAGSLGERKTRVRLITVSPVGAVASNLENKSNALATCS